MSKFIKKILIFTLLLLLSIIGIVSFSYFVIGSQYQYSYQASLIDKVDRLKNIDEPKIILVGHSNLSFGIKSEMIEEAFGMPVVNLGLHGGLGNAYHEQIAKLGINAGDIVVICHSSFSDNDIIVDTELAWVTIDNNIELWEVIRLKDYLSMMWAYPTYVKKSALLWLTKRGNQIPEGSYSRKAFNKYGDVIYKPKYNQMNVDAFFEQNKVFVPQINDVCTNRLNKLYRYCVERGATMVVAGYPIAYGVYAEFSKKDFINFQLKLGKVLDSDIISDYTEYFYPYHYFYDTDLHLTEEGAIVRTKQLISDLKNWMSDN